MRAALAGFVLIVFVGAASAQPEYPSPEGKFSVKFPGTPKVTTQTAKSAVGDLTVNVAVYANADGSAFMVSYTDFPAATTKAEKLMTLFDGIREAVSKDGKIVGEEKKFDFGAEKLPAREFTVEKAKQRIRYRVIVRDNRVYQLAAIGTEAFATGKDGTAFLDSFQITK